MQTNEKLREYVSLISQRLGGIEGLLERAGRLPFRSKTSGFELETADHDPARAAIEKLAKGRELDFGDRFALEAIIDEELRPAFDVIDNTFDPDHPVWTHLGSNAQIRTRIEERLPSVGRVELVGHSSLPYAGTGFVVGDDLLMTNRHVAEVFAGGLGVKHLAFRPGLGAGVDFLREYGRPNEQVFQVKRVMMIHPYWDMALLQVPRITDGRRILELSVKDARDLVAHSIIVVGYPAFDRRNPTDVQNSLFGRRFGVKKLQPGELQGGYQTASFGKLVAAASHDCSTQGGNSGSAVIDVETGEVFGVHFGGAYHERNYAVPSAALATDARVVDAGVRFTGIATGNHDWAGWWQRADAVNAYRSTENRDASASTAQLSQSAAPNVLISAASGAIKLRLPGPVELTLETQAGERPETAVDALEGLKQPFHDEDYDTRTGFDGAFLGEGGALWLSLPSAKDPDLVAPTLDGHGVLHYQNFSVVMHRHRRLALFTAANISRDADLRTPDPRKKYGRKDLAGLTENDQEKWFLDPRIDLKYQLPDVFFTKDRRAFDKGHLVRRDDVAWGSTYDELRRANGDSYHVTNCSPQVAGFNRSNLGDDNWGDLENHVLKSAANERLSVFAGPVLATTDDVFTGVGDRGAVIRARIPSRYWKIIVARNEDGLRAFGFVLEQDLGGVEWEFAVPEAFVPVMYPIAEIEEAAGLDFGEAIRGADQYDAVVGLELAMQDARVRRWSGKIP